MLLAGEGTITPGISQQHQRSGRLPSDGTAVSSVNLGFTRSAEPLPDRLICRGPTGLELYEAYNNGYPPAYGNIIHLKGMTAVWRRRNYSSAGVVISRCSCSVHLFVSRDGIGENRTQTGSPWGACFNNSAHPPEEFFIQSVADRFRWPSQSIPFRSWLCP